MINDKSAPEGFVVDKKKNFMSLEEQSNHKYILNIDGHVKAFRLGNELRMGSVVLLVDSPYTLWFQDKLVEYKHYIPVSSDLSDLQEKIEWCIDNDSKCKKIAENSLEFYNKYLDKDGVYDYFEKLIYDMGNSRIPPVLKKTTSNINFIIGYRDPGDGVRKSQLDVFIQQINLIFSKISTINIYVIEQESERSDYETLPELIKQTGKNMAKFNLGRLKNIGFSIAEKQNKQQDAHYILTDVDLLPSYDLIEKYLQYPENPIHLAHIGTRYDKSRSKSFLGGVLSVNKKDFMDCNGYPNDFWGWGGEDDVLFRRFQNKKIKIDKPEEPVVDLEEFDLTEKNINLKENDAKLQLKNEKIKQSMFNTKENGLIDVNSTYDIINETEKDTVKHYKVMLKITVKDKQKVEEIKIQDYKLGMKVSWMSKGNVKLTGLVKNIDDKTSMISVEEEKTKELFKIKFFKLEIID